MEVSGLTWTLTTLFVVGMLLFDFLFHARRPHTPGIRESALWSALYTSIALAFGLFVLGSWGGHYAAQYYAGYITELSLSVDNLFVFLIIMASFKVPRQSQQEVLLFGIVVSLIFRSALIFVGAAAINAFSWVFYIFGVILLVTAGSTLKEAIGTDDEEESENFFIRLVRGVFHTSDTYDGNKLFTELDGKRALTPMLLVMVAIGGTDVLFALDSIPAIFGLTQEVFLVFTAVVFSLMGLKQLFFLIDGLLDRLIYLSYGLAAILGFIAVKLILHALHQNSLPFINDGDHVTVIEITTQMSLVFILGVLVVTVAVSLFSPRGRAMAIIRATEDLAEKYLALPPEAAVAERTKLNNQLAAKLSKMPQIPDHLKSELIENEQHYRDLLKRAHGQHQDFLAQTAREG
ncbi:TerC family protein [Raineyella fluvialis]|uniref:TerC/Alx family metal homeostasis membrane protein n=1 Tax=Raineyella fluvialis TaxID=2662261 RepID=A0A5Q2FEZ8_9ACTN|nr:TerC family protein [Raineyella fluvialis]QGF23673.1 TerC/Alx family metal homeostasis membrane protein [Raineyella fluvialis]